MCRGRVSAAGSAELVGRRIGRPAQPDVTEARNWRHIAEQKLAETQAGAEQENAAWQLQVSQQAAAEIEQLRIQVAEQLAAERQSLADRYEAQRLQITDDRQQIEEQWTARCRKAEAELKQSVAELEHIRALAGQDAAGQERAFEARLDAERQQIEAQWAARYLQADAELQRRQAELEQRESELSLALESLAAQQMVQSEAQAQLEQQQLAAKSEAAGPAADPVELEQSHRRAWR